MKEKNTWKVKPRVNNSFVQSAHRTSVLYSRLTDFCAVLLRAVLPVHVFLTPFSCLMVKSIALIYGIPKSIREINISPSMCNGKTMGDVQIIHMQYSRWILIAVPWEFALTKNFCN